jgi:hypothetical protein
MDTEIDTNKIITGLVSDFVNAAMQSGKEFATSVSQKAKVRFDIGLSNYVEKLAERCGKIKTLLYRDAPVSLLAHYVPARLASQEVACSDATFFCKIKPGFHVALAGTAGSGKSIFVKRVCLELLKGELGFVPILIELRHLNGEERIPILDFAAKTLAMHAPIFTRALLEYGLGLNKFCFVLDGFDELGGHLRPRYSKEIIELANRFPETPILVSGRPDEVLETWEKFSVFRVLPMEMEDAADLISKIRYDENIKDHFIHELRGTLFERHRDFSSNPLLLTMMLLTYEQYARIPDKIYLFYDEAFTTLFHRHDATKSLYQRESYTKLPIDEFKRLFASFCFFSLFDGKYSFSETQLREYIARAMETEAIGIEIENFISDLLLSVCLLQRDGIEVSFVHRSFQEYFCALFLLSNPEVNLKDAIEHLIRSSPSSSVVGMLAQINLQRVEQEWVTHYVGGILRAVGRTNLLQRPSAFLQLITHEIDFSVDGRDERHMVAFNLGDGDRAYNFHALHTVHRMYPDLGVQRSSITVDDEADVEFVMREMQSTDEIGLDPAGNDHILAKTSLAAWSQTNVDFLRDVAVRIRVNQKVRKDRIVSLMKRIRNKHK